MIEERIVRNVLAAALETGGDYSELYMEDTEQNNVSMVDGKVENAQYTRRTGAGVRVETAGRAGMRATVRYDSLLAKVIVTGADRPEHHVVDLVCGRDFTPDGTIEAAEVREGDPAPDGSGTLVAARGIEIGHIFQLGRKYTDAISLDALGQDGKPQRITMGSYGIGVSRLVAAIAEQNNDELGLVWPREVAPADVHVVIAGKDDAVREGGERLAAELDEAGVRAI